MTEILLGLLSGLVLLILYIVYMFLIKIYWDARWFKAMDPTLKTFIAPFSGLQGVQKANLAKYGDTHYFTKQLMKDNPQQNAYLTNIGYKPLLQLCSTKLIKQMALNPKLFKKFNIFKHSNKSYTKGIFFSEGDDWAAQKSIIRHSFNFESLKRMIPFMLDGTEQHMNKIKQQIAQSPNKQKEFDTLHETEMMIGDILVRIFFSAEAVGKTIFGKNVSVALTEYTATMFKRSRTAHNIFLELFLGERVTRINFSKGDRDLESLIDESRRIIGEIIENRLKMSEEQQEKDFIYDYISEMKDIDRQIEQAQKQGKPKPAKLRKITREELVQQLISFYFAGIDTTGHLIALSLYCLAEYPEFKQKVVEEVQGIVKSKDDLTYENLQKMDYFNKFLDEVLRMWPPAVGVLIRVAQQDIQLGPYSVRKGMLVGANFIGVMHNPKYYTNPEQFNPDRWYDRTKLNEQPYSFIPFSAGTRSCIGKYLALMEAKLTLIGFLNNFDIERTQIPLRMHAKFLYEPENPRLVRFKEGGIRLYQ